jgi:hypothetical protein
MRNAVCVSATYNVGSITGNRQHDKVRLKHYDGCCGAQSKQKLHSN